MKSLSLIPRKQPRKKSNFEMKIGSQSLTIESGRPCDRTTIFMMTSARLGILIKNLTGLK